MSYALRQGIAGYDNIAAGSVTGRENTAVGSLPPNFDAESEDAPVPIAATSITRSGQTATLTTPGGGHGLVTGNIVAIRGCDQADYNGDFVFTRTSGTVGTFQVQGAPTTPATGTITSRWAGPTNNAPGVVNPEPERLG